MDSLKLLKGMLISVHASGLLTQFLREDSLMFSMIENDRDSLEWMLENIPLDKENWITLVKARRKLIPGLKEVDFSYELNLINSYLDKNISGDFLNEIEASSKVGKILSQNDRKIFIDAYAMESFLKDFEKSPFLFESFLNFNKLDIINLSNNIDKKIEELLIKSKEDGRSFIAPDNFHNLKLLRSSFYAENQFKKGKIDLNSNYENPEDLTDIDFLVEAIKQNYKNYDYINENLMLDKRIIEVLISKLEYSLDQLMSDKNEINQLSSLGISEVSKKIATFFDQYLEKDNRKFLDDGLKARCIAIGVPINGKLLKDKEMLEIVSVNYSIFEKFQENKKNKALMQSGGNLNSALFLDSKVFSGLPVFSKICDILEKEKFFTELNKNQSIKEHYNLFNNWISILKDELKKNENLKDFVSNNQNFEWSKFAGARLKDCRYGEIKNFLEVILPEVDKILMKKDIIENPPSVKRQNILKF